MTPAVTIENDVDVEEGQTHTDDHGGDAGGKSRYGEKPKRRSTGLGRVVLLRDLEAGFLKSAPFADCGSESIGRHCECKQRGGSKIHCLEGIKLDGVALANHQSGRVSKKTSKVDRGSVSQANVC